MPVDAREGGSVATGGWRQYERVRVQTPVGNNLAHVVWLMDSEVLRAPLTLLAV